MMESSGFKGFPKEAVSFFTGLAENNGKLWFDERKKDYERFVLAPARAFVEAMGPRLKKISPGVIADPRINQSLFRIYRDARFSKDKRPYKTHLGILFWEGGAKRMECPGFYFHLEPPDLMLAAGMYVFSRPLLEVYRNSVVHPKQGPALARAVKEVTARGYAVGGSHYKKVPHGFDPSHKNAALLLHDGLFAMTEERIPRELYSSDLLDYCERKWREMAPIHRRLKQMNERT